uniref:Uncharacterized protein n=1 Tax=Rhizophora mucronata TaxID=61149 RepID=A0A2P2Q0Q4_RHIMU
MAIIFMSKKVMLKPKPGIDHKALRRWR